MTLAPATASHTFKDQGYKYKMSTKDYNKYKKAAKKQAKQMSKQLGHAAVGYSGKMVKVSKTSKVYFVKNKVMNKNYSKQTMNKQKNGWKYIKTVRKGNTVYQVYKKSAKMNCKIEYYNGHYDSYGVVF